MPIIYMPSSGLSRFCVYHLINSAIGLPFYVGYTSDPHDRMKSHRKGNLATTDGRARQAVLLPGSLLTYRSPWPSIAPSLTEDKR
jgi:hypothetical protein